MKRRQVTCTCEAYDFPHRFGGGRCDGLSIVVKVVGSSSCHWCHLNNGGCEVLKGQEHPRECPGVQDYLAYNEITLC